jgi:large subunit ribosomal protein L9
MKVILQQNVQKLGKAGDIVEASDGYFRNFLQPRKLAILATTGTLKKREEDLETLRRKAETLHQESVAQGDKIKELGSIRVEAKAGEGGKLYGKVTTKEIAQVLSKHLGHEVDKRNIRAADDISALGTYKVTIKLTPEVQSELTVEVVQEGAPIVPKKTAPVAQPAEDIVPEEEITAEETVSA